MQNIVALKVTRTLIFFHLHNILKNYGKLTNNIYTCRYGYLTKHTLEYIKCMIEFETLEKLYGIEKTSPSPSKKNIQRFFARRAMKWIIHT